MKNLKIEATKTTFGIYFDGVNRTLEFSGNSYPSNPMVFFQPLIEWVEDFLFGGPKEKIEVIFKVNYYNTTSSKYIYRILDILDDYHKKQNNVALTWYDNDSDDDLLDAWKSLIAELSLPFEVVR